MLHLGNTRIEMNGSDFHTLADFNYSWTNYSAMKPKHPTHIVLGIQKNAASYPPNQWLCPALRDPVCILGL